LAKLRQRRHKPAFQQWQRTYYARPDVRAQRNADAIRAYADRSMPAWVDQEAILPFYQEAIRLTAATGIAHEVDHIVPVVHPDVSGLHVPWNLQVVPHYENRRKKNCFPWPPHYVFLEGVVVPQLPSPPTGVNW